MPELPEVETVRRGLAEHITGAAMKSVRVLENRSIRQHALGARDFEDQLAGLTIECISRRGKFLWLPLRHGKNSTGTALVCHLGMSGQALLVPRSEPMAKHARIQIQLKSTDFELHFVDQRMFGGMHVDELVAGDAGDRLPRSVTHIARDVLDPLFDEKSVITALRRRSAGIKSLLLNQNLLSGIGNIYADEALWRSKIHYGTPGSALSASKLSQLLHHVQEVMIAALAAGGTTFDDLYVGVNGESGWFDLSLEAYGQEGMPCSRCGAAIVREAWSNRSSHRCPRCQRAPRQG